jgi:SPP1 gp7 family putative phage head morphogenesis protein
MAGILKGRTEDELKRQAGILGKTVLHNARKAEAIVNGSFKVAKVGDQSTFSDRIWQYQDVMRQDLGKLLQQGLIQGKNPRAITKDLRKYWYGNDPKTGGGATYCMERLMRTELARVQTEAQKQSFERNGFEHYEFIANRGCCPICSGLDGKHFEVAKMMPGENAPPVHPHCRCSTAAWEDDEEYEAWLDYLDHGGTTAEWNDTGKKSWENSRKALENSGNGATIKAQASVLPNRFKKFLPDSKRRLEIIEEGKNLEKPIFASGLLGTLALELEPEPGFYDVVIHGYPYGLEYFGEKIDVETLCAIIAQRKDYHKGTNIRLIACQAGAKDDGVAQYIADKLHVVVVAPDKLGVVERKRNGKTVVYSGSASGVHDGEMKPFTPHEEVK